MTLLMALVFVASVSEEEVTKTVPGDCIDPGNEFDVTINTSGTGVVIKDALPGWTYKSSSLEAYQVSVSGNVMTFILAGYQSFTYAVEALDTADACLHH